MEKNLLQLGAILIFAILSTTSLAQDFKKACVPGKTYYNTTLSKGVGAGTYIRIGNVKSLQDCIEKVCSLKKGDIVYMLESFCYAVDCFNELSCDRAALPFSQDLKSILVEMNWKVVAVIPTEKPTPTIDTSMVVKPNKPEGPQKGPDGKVARSAEHRLLQDIIYTSSYDREVRPVLLQKNQLKIFFQLKLVQLVEVSSREETVRLNVWTTQQWTDPFLRWEPDKYDGIDTINVEPHMIWLPIVILFNNAASGFSGGLEKYKTKVVINKDGTVKWFSATQFLSACKINIRYFPFDEQYCYMTFGSWTYSTKQLDMLTNQTQADMSSYIVNGEWDVIEVPVKANKVQYPCCEDTFSDITYTIHLRRKVAYYVFNLIIPSMMIVVFALVGFCLPPESGERIALNITVLLSITVFLNIVSNTLPATSDSIPLLGYFYLMIMIELCSAIIVSTIVLRFYYFGHVRMPEKLRIVINEWIASMLFFIITEKPKDKGIYQCMAAKESSERICKWMPQHSHTMQSYVVTKDEHLEDRASLIECNTPNVRRNNNPPIQAPPGMTKCRSEPAINSLGMPTNTKIHQRRKMSCVPRKRNINDVIQRKIAEGLEVLTKRVKDEGEKDECIQEWQFAATVLDRLCFAIFLVTMCIPVLFFFFSSPDSQPEFES